MAGNTKVNVLLRTTEQKNKNVKNKVAGLSFDKVSNCLLKQSHQDSNNIVKLSVFADRIKINPSINIKQIQNTKAHGNSETFLEVMQYALDNYEPEDIVYFVEDDYIHRGNWNRVLVEGLERADYVSLYDHPDKYTGNPEILFHTKSTHWKFTHSTTMTFACKVKTLIYDAPVFQRMITTGNPPDHQIFTHLTQRLHRRLATPIPGYATHGEIEHLSPCIDWGALL